MQDLLTDEQKAQQVAERFTGKHLKVFGDTMILDASGTVRTLDGTPIWEFEEDNYKTWTPEEAAHEVESIFWHDKDMLDSTLND